MIQSSETHRYPNNQSRVLSGECPCHLLPSHVRNNMVPPNLFTEDDFPPVEKKLLSWSSHCFGQTLFGSSSSSSSSCSGSSLSSPGESELGYTESESDQDDEYVAELTRQMTCFMLQDDDSTRKNAKALNLNGSLQPNVLWPSQGEVIMVDKFKNLKINEDDKFKYQNRESYLAASLSPNSTLPNPRNPDGLRSDFQSKQALIDEQIRAIKLNKFNEDKIARKRQEECLGWGSRPIVCHQTEPSKQIRQVQSKASWANNNNLHNQQQMTGSKLVRAVQPVGPKSGSSGTGVFLPRGDVGNHSKPRKKLGCSTVKIPAKVVHALKLHFDRVGVPSRSNSAISLLQNYGDGIIGDVSYCLQLQEKSQSRTAPAIIHHNPQISCLPQEWTY